MPPRPDEEGDVFSPEALTREHLRYLALPRTRTAGGALDPLTKAAEIDAMCSEEVAFISRGDLREIFGRKLSKEALRQYQKGVPEFLQKRSILARLGWLSSADDVYLEPQDYGEEKPELVDALADVGVSIDMDMPEWCNLDAMSIRNFLLPIMAADKDTLASYVSLPFRELKWSEGQFVSNTYESEDRPRLVIPIAAKITGESRLVFWCDLETTSEKRLFRKDKTVINTSQESLAELPITIGLSYPEGYLPLFKNMKTATGCHVVFPDGQEIDGESYNRSAINYELANLIVRGENGAFDALLEKLSVAANSDGYEIAHSVDLIQRLLRPGVRGSYAETAMKQLSDKCAAYPDGEYGELQEVRMDPFSQELTTINVVADRFVQGSFEMNGMQRNGSLKIGWKVDQHPVTKLRTHTLTVYTGLDETEYTKGAVLYPLFSYASDRINPPEIQAFDINRLPRDMDESDKERLEVIIPHLLPALR